MQDESYLKIRQQTQPEQWSKIKKIKFKKSAGKTIKNLTRNLLTGKESALSIWHSAPSDHALGCCVFFSIGHGSSDKICLPLFCECARRLSRRGEKRAAHKNDMLKNNYLWLAGPVWPRRPQRSGRPAAPRYRRSDHRQLPSKQNKKINDAFCQYFH